MNRQCEQAVQPERRWDVFWLWHTESRRQVNGVVRIDQCVLMNRTVCDAVDLLRSGLVVRVLGSVIESQC